MLIPWLRSAALTVFPALLLLKFTAPDLWDNLASSTLTLKDNPQHLVDELMSLPSHTCMLLSQGGLLIQALTSDVLPMVSLPALAHAPINNAQLSLAYQFPKVPQESELPHQVVAPANMAFW
ncbi:hypothetical protein DSO57_1020197 [Entomophthora muscae]|uniref:Uncharacterized protein n=1 Tax=Entomophthora muscae TaxID=34485 RepID=A0ACC2SGR1_9FUNG|nr:hypothetical protein DSO57_1020197 [Entomophthora muscae]